jgi:hypothetical protein
MKKNRTVGIDYEGHDIPIEEMIETIKSYRNTTVISFLDCCRVEEEDEKE